MTLDILSCIFKQIFFLDTFLFTLFLSPNVNLSKLVGKLEQNISLKNFFYVINVRLR